MDRIMFIFFVLSVFTISCKIANDSTKSKISDREKEDFEYTKYHFNYDSLELQRLVLLFPDFLKLESINTNDTITIDSILRVLISENNTVESEISVLRLNQAEKYYKQIVPFRANNGSLNVWVNCSCGYKDYWKKRIIQIDDGGSCFFNFFISLDSKKYYGLAINSL